MFKKNYILSLLKTKKYYLFFSIFFVLLSFYFTLFLVKPNINQIPYSTVIYDTNNIRIWEIIKDNKYRHEKLEFIEIPEFTKNVVIFLEDKTFYSNSWIDYIAILRAFITNIKEWKVIEWASTISSQVIRNNYWLNEKRTITRKVKEFYLSIALNKKYSKEEIITNYLESIYFWYLNYWIKSASHYFFDKDIQNLTKAEQIGLIALPKNPKKYDPYTSRQEFKNRFEQICNKLLYNKVITKKEYEEIRSEKLIFNENHDNKLPYVIDFLSNKWKLISDNWQLQSTFDYNMTKKINEISKNSIIPLLWKNVKDYWIIIIDKNTKELKVMIWWINYYSENWQVNITTSPRQVWSTIKPFTYVLAFKNLWYTPSTTLIDLPTQFQTNLWYAYTPKNYSLDYKWEVTIAEALSQSINIPAVKTLEKVWVQNLLDFLKIIWISTLDKDADYYWLAITLGVSEISLYELTKAYSIFAYNWELCDINFIKSQAGKDSKCKQIIDKKYTDMIKEILTNRYYKLESFPINWNLDFPNKEVFLKTGTSRNFKDNWTVWFTKNYIIWVWAWNKDWSEMKWVSWATWAWEIFKSIVDYLENNDIESNKKILEKDNIIYLEITSPLNWSKYQIDNNKENYSQKIKLDFSTNLTYDNYKWYVNWEEQKDNFINLKKWGLEIIIKLYDINHNIVWEQKSSIYIN